MQQIARVIPIKSKEALIQLAKEAMAKPQAERRAFCALFGENTTEHWYYQELEGKPHVVVVLSGEHLEDGFAKYAELSDPFFEWLRSAVQNLSGIDLRTNPRAAPSEHVAEINDQ